MRYSHAFVQVEELSEHLEDQNKQLEIQNERLKTLDKLKDEFETIYRSLEPPA